MSQLASRINKKLLTMILASTTICASGVPVAIAYTLNNQMLAMYVIAENAPISWEMVIQPKGTPNNYYVDGKKLGTQHDLIYLWNGANKTVQIYAR